MPYPVIYNGGQDDDRTRSIDSVHIEPSIREGVNLVSSLYGHKASFPIYRYPPVNLVLPFITGSPLIPSTLTCEVGSWNASPTSQYFFQWMANGVDIPSETNQTLTTTLAHDGITFTCEVRAMNTEGEDYAITSNSITATIIEPIELRTQVDAAITGLNSKNFQTIQIKREVFITGIGALNASTVVRSVGYFLTGRAANFRLDTNAMNLCMIQGRGSEGRFMVASEPGLLVVNYPYNDPLVTSVPVIIQLKNWNAEMGTEGWSIFGAAIEYSTVKKDGNYSWWGGANVHSGGSNIPYSYMWQDVPMESVWISDIDAGDCTLELSFYQSSDAGNDKANVKVEFLAADQTTVIGYDAGPGIWSSPSGIFFLREKDIPIPSGTRYIRIIPEFQLFYGNNNDAFIDQIVPKIRKGVKIVDRSYGPNFEQWRVRFTLANSYSGCAVSEIEFRSTSGGADLATGGSAIAGSEGLGGLKSYAFDDLRSSGYWAGEQNAVGNDTAWIGYDMGTPVKPQEIDITARSGTDSFQVGLEFTLEGSNNGIHWTKVQQYVQSQIGTFTSGQQKQFPVVTGAIPAFKDTAAAADYTYSRSTNTTDDFSGKGALFKSYARFDITHLLVLLDDNQGTPFNYRMQLARCSLEKNGSQQPGMISEVLEDIALTSPGTNSGLQWVTVPCTISHDFEVGDLFLVRFYDVNASTNPVQANEGRTRYMTTGSALTPFQTRHVADRFADWRGGNQDLTVGLVNPSPYVGATGNYWTVDFKGTVF